MYHFLNGKIVEDKDAMISVNDLAALRGYAVFDFFRTYDRKPFMIDEHLKRFENSARLLNLNLRYSREEIKDIIDDLLKRNKGDNLSFRFLLTGGDGMRETFAVLAEEHDIFPEEMYKKGVKLITYNHLREMPEAKTTAYATKSILVGRLGREKALEPLYISSGNVLEAASSNIFMINGDNLVTPKENVLRGVTRDIILELAKDDFNIQGRDIQLDEIHAADEVFITATLKEVMPVTMIDECVIGDGIVGEGTKKIIKLFSEYKKNV